jgi:predicted transcriptional regulator
VLGLGGYARHEGDPLEHETRARLAEYVESSPGAYLSELAEATDTPLGTVRYHLKVLEREDVLSRTKARGRRRYYPVGGTPDELAAALDEEGAGDVLRALAGVGPSSVSGLADELDRDASTVSHHLDRLADEGLVERERDGRAVVNRLPPAVEAAVTPGVEDADGVRSAPRTD